ncbi:MAG: arsenite methyltransferase [Candidatus Krumholzibacteria bacterium]|nr:arsenite methyltransferase [Candidatus Krumholzibacteria bacterium]
MSNVSKDKLRNQVRKKYAEAAESKGCCGPSCCSEAGPVADEVSTFLGYTAVELADLPEGSNLGLGCGNPVAIASLEEGDTVLDLGSGAGIDCFLSSAKVGGSGRVIGIDMTPEMISKSRFGAEEGGFTNVEFRLGEIEHIPAADNSVNVVISNCVINLSPDKQQVFREVYRVLKPGGRLAVSDIVAIEEMPDNIRSDAEAYSGCIAGAILVPEIENMLAGAGFSDISIQIKKESMEMIKSWFSDLGAERYVRSAYIEARKK